MPLSITPAVPFATSAQVPVATVYAIINYVSFRRVLKRIDFSVGYYASEAACDAGAMPLDVQALPTDFSQPATPEQADAVPIFQFLEQVLTAQLTAHLPATTAIATV